MLNRIYSNLHNNECSLGLFVDLSEAFDMVNHDILLQKLHYHGIKGTPLQWLIPYLANRQQSVVLTISNDQAHT